MGEICDKYRVKQVSERSYPANFIEKTDELINLPMGFGESLMYQALPNFVTQCVELLDILLLLFRPW